MKIKILYFFLFIIFTVAEMKSQVTIGSLNNPDNSALLDLKNQSDGSSDKGLLLPRVAITNSAQFGLAGNSGAEGMMVYNTIANANNSGKGLYYWNGTGWNKIRDNDIQLNWLKDGNINGAVRTLGTKDAFDLPLITNNVERMRITSAGNVGIGTTAPKARFSVSGGAISQDDYTIGDKLFMMGYTGAEKISLNTGMNFAFYAGAIVGSNGITPASQNAGQFVWNVADVSNNWREIIRLTNNARLGIGTNNPQATLHVAGTALMEHDMKVFTLPQASPADNALVADTNGSVKLTTTPIPQRFNFTTTVTPGGTGTITRPTYTGYTPTYSELTITTTNSCGDVAVANFILYKGILSFVGGQAQGVKYSGVTIGDVATVVMTVNLPTPCAGATSSQFNFSIIPSGNTFIITNNGTTTLDYSVSEIDF